MLNWIAIWVGQYLFGLGGPLQNVAGSRSIPISNDIVPTGEAVRLLGRPATSRASRSGSSSRSAALVVYWIILNRTTLGFGVKAVGFNPEAARYGGINVSRNYFLAMAISGMFAGLAGALDILGWQFHIATSDITALADRLRRHRRRAARAQHRRRRRALGAAVRARSSTARRRATSIPRSSSRSSRRT